MSMVIEILVSKVSSGRQHLNKGSYLIYLNNNNSSTDISGYFCSIKSGILFKSRKEQLSTEVFFCKKIPYRKQTFNFHLEKTLNGSTEHSRLSKETQKNYLLKGSSYCK